MAFVYLTLGDTPGNIFADGAVALVNDTQVSAAILANWDAAELAAIGLVRAAITAPAYDPRTHACTGAYEAVAAGEGWEWRATLRPLGPDEIAAHRAEAWDGLRSARNARLAETDVLVRRHVDQLELIAAGMLAVATLDAAEYQALLVYRQALRDLVDDTEPEAAVWPVRPAFV